MFFDKFVIESENRVICFTPES